VGFFVADDAVEERRKHLDSSVAEEFPGFNWNVIRGGGFAAFLLPESFGNFGAGDGWCRSRNWFSVLDR